MWIIVLTGLEAAFKQVNIYFFINILLIEIVKIYYLMILATSCVQGLGSYAGTANGLSAAAVLFSSCLPHESQLHFLVV